jgi:hypothetical protein
MFLEKCCRFVIVSDTGCTFISFESWVLPNNDVMRALAESPSLTKLILRNCESEYGVQNYNDSFNLGGFTHLTFLLLHWVTTHS